MKPELAVGSLTQARWRIKPAEASAVRHLAESLRLGPLAARALVCRGIADPEEARRFLAHDLSGLLDPDTIRDMDRAVARVQEALARGAPIRVYGDYDVDGVCGTALLVRALQGLGGKVDWYIPHRVDEGYGLNEEAVRQAHAEGIALLITVDCGSTAVAEVALARRLGLEVVVCDHHRPGEELPEAPVLNPWRADCPYPFKELAGVGVAFKLVTALARARGLREGAELRFLDLVCLGTVADVVPLLGENRLFVQHGLRRLSRPGGKLGLSALIEAAGLSREISARDVAFILAPRINAAGRIEHAQAAVKLLLTRDSEEARRGAAHLSQQNLARREQEEQTLAEAEELVGREIDLGREKVLVLASEGWHPGVIGIVASRLVERYHRPALLVAVREGMGKGSGRSVAAFNLWEALRECASLLGHYGGHRYAAGFEVAAEQIGALRRRINEVADARLSANDLVRIIDIDGEARLSELSRGAVSELNRLAPFGMGNPSPLLSTRGVRVAESQAVGDGSHLSLRLAEGPDRWLGAIWFRHGDLQGRLEAGAVVDVCYRPRLEEWNQDLRVRLHVEDMGLRTEG